MKTDFEERLEAIAVHGATAEPIYDSLSIGETRSSVVRATYVVFSRFHE